MEKKKENFHSLTRLQQRRRKKLGEGKEGGEMLILLRALLLRKGEKSSSGGVRNHRKAVHEKGKDQGVFLPPETWLR